MSRAEVTPVAFVDEGLGNSSYLVDLGDGRGLLVDPARDPAAYLAEADRRGLEIAFAVETHLHADFVSGSRELAALGADLLAPGDAQHGFAITPMHDGSETTLGNFGLRALATPGHTPEHLSYLLVDGSEPLALFSGGSLLVGAVARTDLISADQTEALARQLWRSLHEHVLTLPDDLRVYPTHGAGSFCSAPTGADRTTTIGRERAANPLLAAADEDAFVRALLDGLGTYPPYFLRLREVNRAGARLYGPATPSLPQLQPADAARLQAAGAWTIDVRPIGDFARAHVPGSVSIALRPQFATWLGWVVPADAALVFVLNDDQDDGEVIRQARNIGYETILGKIAGGIAGWTGDGRAVESTALVPVAEVDRRVLDVRQAREFASGHLPRALNHELGSIGAAATPDEPVAVMCAHGERAMTAASLLARRGRRDVAALVGGPDDWARAHGQLER